MWEAHLHGESGTRESGPDDLAVLGVLFLKPGLLGRREKMN